MTKKLHMPADFWLRVNKSAENQCWEWMGGLNNSGYGSLGYGGRVFAAHRLSFELTFGKIPDGMKVLHRCDNPKCVNPNHLFLGTQQDNIRDRDAKGRQSKGHSRPNAKLNESDIKEIRRLYGAKLLDGKQLAVKFGVRNQTIYSIIHRKTWKHV